MIKINIPGNSELDIHYAVFDYNGTLASDGTLQESTKALLQQLKEQIDVYILTSDTYGTVAHECRDLGITIETINGTNSSDQKRKFVSKLGPANTVCIGNGMNDRDMFQICALSFVVIGAEGAAVKALANADIVMTNIDDVFHSLLKPQRITATLRD